MKNNIYIVSVYVVAFASFFHEIIYCPQKWPSIFEPLA